MVFQAGAHGNQPGGYKIEPIPSHGRRERMGATARIGVAMGEMRVGANRRAQQLGERMRWLGDEAKRWLWRDAG